MTTRRARTAPRTSDHLGLPPPLDFELRDADRVAGWVRGHAIGFRGFADATEAVHAAWVAHRALAQRIARRDGRRPIPVDIEPLALQRRGDEEVVLASGQPIATLRRPVVDDPSGDATFGFELRIPPPADELSMRSLAYVVYSALRKSGVRWALWARTQPRADRGDDVAHAAAATATAPPTTATTRPSPGSRRGIDRRLDALGVIAMLVVVLAVVIVAPAAVGVVFAMATVGALTLLGIIELRWLWSGRRTRRTLRRADTEDPARIPSP